MVQASQLLEGVEPGKAAINDAAATIDDLLLQASQQFEGAKPAKEIVDRDRIVYRSCLWLEPFDASSTSSVVAGSFGSSEGSKFSANGLELLANAKWFLHGQQAWRNDNITGCCNVPSAIHYM